MLKTHKAGGARGGNAYGAYTVRYASDKQINFIKTLLSTKEHNYTLSDEVLSKLNVQGAGELITSLVNLPTKADVVIPPTERQVSFAQSLILSKEGGQEMLANVLQSRKALSLEQLSRSDVSAIINGLKVAPELSVSIKISEVGAYLLDGVIYSIRQGRESKKWQVWTYSSIESKYARLPKDEEVAILKKIQPADRLTLENAIKYSVQTGICCHCGRTLTQLKSVTGGIGPICAKKYN